MLPSSKASPHCASGLIVPVKMLENVDLHVRVLELHVFFYKKPCSRQHMRQILIGWHRNYHRRIPTSNVARIHSKSIEKRVLVVKIVFSLRRN